MLEKERWRKAGGQQVEEGGRFGVEILDKKQGGGGLYR
jgi:hypothetical protein